MKQKVLAYIHKIKQLFAAKQLSMAGSVTHKPYIAAIAKDEEDLDDLESCVNLLKEADEATFAPSLMVLMMDKCVPILRHWKQRFVTIHNANKLTEGHPHVSAYHDFVEERNTMFDLIVELNALKDNPMIAFEPCDKPAIAIIANFEKEAFLATHDVQKTEPESGNYLYSACKSLFSGYFKL